MKHIGDIELIGGEIINLVAGRLDSDPAFDAADAGIIYYNTVSNAYRYNNGAAWVTFEVSLTSSTILVDTLGNNWINENFSFNPDDFNTMDNVTGLTASDTLYSVLSQFDAAITSSLNVITLRGVSLDFVEGDLESGQIVLYNGTNFVPGTVNDLDTVSLSADELNDTAFTSLADNNMMVFQNGEWVNKPIVYQYNELSGTLSVFSIPHGLGTQFCDVTVIDRSTAPPQKMDPAVITTIEYNDSNNLTVTLTGNKAVTVIIVGLSAV